MSEDTPEPRPGSTLDLSRRMDKLEGNHATLAKEVANLTGTVARVELNQKHAEDLNKLRFDALDAGVKLVQQNLDGFMKRIEGIITGEVETTQAKQGRELVADYQRWRGEVDDDRNEWRVQAGQLRVLARLALLVFGSNIVTVGISLWIALHR